jgi:hypothetical protein
MPVGGGGCLLLPTWCVHISLPAQKKIGYGLFIVAKMKFVTLKIGTSEHALLQQKLVKQGIPVQINFQL